ATCNFIPLRPVSPPKPSVSPPSAPPVAFRGPPGSAGNSFFLAEHPAGNPCPQLCLLRRAHSGSPFHNRDLSSAAWAHFSGAAAPALAVCAHFPPAPRHSPCIP